MGVEPTHDVLTTHAWHRKIEEHDVVLLRRERERRLYAVRGFIGHVTGPLDHSSHELAQFICVVNDQEPQRSNARGALVKPGAGRLQRLLRLEGVGLNFARNQDDLMVGMPRVGSRRWGREPSYRGALGRYGLLIGHIT